MVAVIDYDAGNIKSVEKAVESLGFETVLTRDRDILLNADHVILPGVGAFGDAMKLLNSYGLTEVIREVAARQIPLLGICLGQQLLFEMSEESPGVEGIGLFKGSVLRIPSGNGLKVPNIGWNSVNLKGKGRLFEGIEDGSFVYFVHSFYCKAEDRDIVKAEIDYNVTVDASIEKGNVFACQFHPEKSSDTGLRILKNFLTISK
ncbi:imidazole glycerol phosphate synthase subunit HisH [Lachnospiraceae bacterium C1.1]|nr:imidazole glycerol phosphate synthase subunit HisH [Lachnospiraceae bacterium C1.1]